MAMDTSFCRNFVSTAAIAFSCRPPIWGECMHMQKPRILCVSYDATVSKDRFDGLMRAGYDVVGILNIEDAVDLLHSKKFDLVIIGHRFLKDDKRALIVEAERQQTPVLLVCASSPEADLNVSERVYALEGLEGLLTKAGTLLSVRAA